MTCVIVTHDMNLARTAGHIIVLDRGTVCGEGTHDTLYESCSVYRNLYDKAISYKVNQQDVSIDIPLVYLFLNCLNHISL